MKYLELHGPTAVAWDIQEVEAQAASVAVQLRRLQLELSRRPRLQLELCWSMACSCSTSRWLCTACRIQVKRERRLLVCCAERLCRWQLPPILFVHIIRLENAQL